MGIIKNTLLAATCAASFASTAGAQLVGGMATIGTPADYTLKIYAGSGTYDGTELKFWVQLYDGAWGPWHAVNGGIDRGKMRMLGLSDGVDLPNVTKVRTYVGNDGARLSFRVEQGSKFIAFSSSQWVKNEYDTFDYTFKSWPGGGGGNGAQCDIWEQDCPSGYKCVAETLDGEPRCRALSNNPDQVGDPCSSLGVGDGDTCDVDGMCIDGVCQALCSGSAQSPQCPTLDEVCRIHGEGVPLCQQECDPLIYASCDANQTCAAQASSLEIFSCTPTSGPLGTSGDGCVGIDQCAQGHACIPKSALPYGSCPNGYDNCCTPMCDLDEANVCGGGTSCIPFYQSPPPGLEHVGVCAIGL